MHGPRLISALLATLALVAAWQPAAGAATGKTYFGMAVVTEASSACVAAKWTVGRQIPVNYYEQDGLTLPLSALRFSDSSVTLIVRQRANTSWSGPSGSTYDGEISGLDVTFAAHFSGHAAVTMWTSSAVTNARYSPSAQFSNWANISGCTLKLWTAMIQR